MAVAKIAPSSFGRVKKKIKKAVRGLFPPLSERPGQVDYPAIPKALEAAKRQKKRLDEIGK